MNGNIADTLDIKGNLQTSVDIKGYLTTENRINGNLLIGTDAQTTYGGSYTITPSTNEQTLNTNNKIMMNNIHIDSIPYSETPNEFGDTAIIG